MRAADPQSIDTIAPAIVSATITDSVSITLTFDKPLATGSGSQISHYTLQPGNLNPQHADVKGDEVTLTFPVPLAEGTLTLTVHGISNLDGHVLPADTTLSLMYFVPDTAHPFDVLINEILFNPKADGVDFIELYNHSEKTFDLQTFAIANTNANGQHAGHRPIATDQVLFHPHSYLVLTTSPATVKSQYPQAKEDTFVTLPAMPAFPNAAGTAVLINQGRTIDSLAYSASMHAKFIIDPKGVSLEREEFHVPTNAIGNFRSASTAEGGATPGYRNSRSPSEDQGEGLFLKSRTFSPDQDGFEDTLEINYRFAEGGMMANVDIYNDQGVKVRGLIRNQSLAREGQLTWDGVGDSGRRMPVGIYVAIIEIYNATGLRRLYKESFVLASRF